MPLGKPRLESYLDFGQSELSKDIQRRMFREEPDFWGEVVPAAFALENTVGAARERMKFPLTGAPPNPDFNPFREDLVKGTIFEDYPELLIGVHNKMDFDIVRKRAENERRNLDIVMGSSNALGAMLLAGGFDLVNLLPFGAGSVARTSSLLRQPFRMALHRVKRGAQAGFVGNVQAEAILHPLEDFRTPEQAALNITAGTLLGAMIGTVTAVPAAMRARALRDLETDFGRPIPVHMRPEEPPLLESGVIPKEDLRKPGPGKTPPKVGEIIDLGPGVAGNTRAARIENETLLETGELDFSQKPHRITITSERLESQVPLNDFLYAMRNRDTGEIRVGDARIQSHVFNANRFGSEVSEATNIEFGLWSIRDQRFENQDGLGIRSPYSVLDPFEEFELFTRFPTRELEIAHRVHADGTVTIVRPLSDEPFGFEIPGEILPDRSQGGANFPPPTRAEEALAPLRTAGYLEPGFSPITQVELFNADSATHRVVRPLTADQRIALNDARLRDVESDTGEKIHEKAARKSIDDERKAEGAALLKSNPEAFEAKTAAKRRDPRSNIIFLPPKRTGPALVPLLPETVGASRNGAILNINRPMRMFTQDQAKHPEIHNNPMWRAWDKDDISLGPHDLTETDISEPHATTMISWDELRRLIPTIRSKEMPPGDKQLQFTRPTLYVRITNPKRATPHVAADMVIQAVDGLNGLRHVQAINERTGIDPEIPVQIIVIDPRKTRLIHTVAIEGSRVGLEDQNTFVAPSYDSLTAIKFPKGKTPDAVAYGWLTAHPNSTVFGGRFRLTRSIICSSPCRIVTNEEILARGETVPGGYHEDGRVGVSEAAEKFDTTGAYNPNIQATNEEIVSALGFEKLVGSWFPSVRLATNPNLMVRQLAPIIRRRRTRSAQRAIGNPRMARSSWNRSPNFPLGLSRASARSHGQEGAQGRGPRSHPGIDAQPHQRPATRWLYRARLL
jgi:hypothetical protein